MLVFGHATDNTADSPPLKLASAVIGIGGRGDPTAANIPNKLNGTVVPNGYSYVPVDYPAGFDIDNSVAAGVPVLDQKIAQNYDPNDPTNKIVVVGYSEGTLVAENEKRNLVAGANPPSTSQLSFVMIASPNVPNGGIFGRFPTLNLFIVSSNGPAQPTAYNTTYVTNEYDPYGDFPAYFNPVSLVNSLFAVEYVHPDQYYDSVDYNPYTGTGTTPVIVKTVTNSAGGHDTYVFVPAEHLPLLAPIRQFASATGTTVLTEPILSAIEPLLRVLVDMGYTDRQNLNPGTPTTFSLITPPGNIIGAVVATPGALAQGATNLVGGVTSAANSTPNQMAPLDQTTPLNQTLAPNTLSSSTNSTNSPNSPAKLAAVPDPKPGLDAPPSVPSSLSAPLKKGPTLDTSTASTSTTTTTTTSTTTSSSGDGSVLSTVPGAVTGVLGGSHTPSTSSSTPPAAGSTPAAAANSDTSQAKATA
ncbi:MAG TPA: PE-PPE domain-containing protein [Mycobacterium sp.]|nr:PE-PPE domain-containing protein [Mycobacterium sp.]